MENIRQSASSASYEEVSRRLSRRRLLAVGLGLGGVAALAACAPPPPATPPVSTPAPGKPAPGAATVTQPGAPARKLATDLKVAATSISDTLDPQGTLSNSGFMSARQMFDALVTWDEKGEKIVPQLASDWRRIDPTTVEFKLRDDVKFSNGESFTAETVKYNIERLMNSTDPLHADTKTRMGPLAAGEVVNSTTVRVTTKSPDPILLNRLTMLFMVPPKYTAEGGDLKTKPIGTGSFKLAEFITRQRIKWEAWDGSWRGKSTVQTAQIEQVPENATLIAGLRNGQVDIIFQPPADQVAGLQRDGFQVKTVSAGSCTIHSLLPSHPLTRDKRVREAINLAVNKEELLQTVQAGLGRVAQGQLLQPGMLGYRGDIKAIPYDPERAKSLFRDAGVGNAEILISTTPATKPHVDANVGYLTAAGVRARTDQVELASIVQALNRGWDRPMVAWNTDYFHMRDFDVAGVRFTKDWPAPHFDNEEMTQLFRASRTELDEKKRGDQIGRMAQIMHDEFAVLFLLWRDFPTVFSKKVVKLDLPYDTSYYLWKVEKEA